MTLWRRLAYLLPWKRRAAERDMREELDSIAAMAGPRELGNLTLAAEDARAEWGWTRLEALVGDVRYAIRTLWKHRGFSSVALIVLTLGIGATTAIFSVVDAVALRSLPFDEPEGIVAVGQRGLPAKAGMPGKPGPLGPPPGGSTALSRVEPQNYLDWVSQQQVFGSIAAIADANFTLRLPGTAPEDLVAERVTASFFDVLRIRPAVGRTFAAENEVDGRDHVAVLSDAFWRRRFDARPDMIGQTVPLEGASYEVIGILPPGVTYPVGAARTTDLWVPYVVPPSERVRGRGHSVYLQAIARLKPGVSVQQAQAGMDRVGEAINQANPGWNLRTAGIGVRPLRDHVVGASVRSWMLMLLAAVGLVLLIACANVANLQLARATSREREVAVRAALGAGRWRLIRQFMVESLVLSTAGTILAVVLAWWAVQLLRASMPDDLPRVATIALNVRVFTAAAGLALVTGLLFGIVPALQLSKSQRSNPLSESGRSAGAGRGRQRLRAALVVAEVALAVVLLVGAALFIGSFISVMKIDPGLEPRGVLTMQIYPRAQPGQRPPESGAALEQIVQRLRQTPGIVGVAVASPGIPFRPNQWFDAVRGGTAPANVGASIKVVSPDYHRVLRIPATSGRLFEATDGAGSANVVIFNASAARALFPDENALNRLVTVDQIDRTVVGIVPDSPQERLESERSPEVYLPMAQSHATSGFLVIRTSGAPYDVLPAAKGATANVLPDVPARNVATLDGFVAGQTAQRRLNMLMLGLFGLLGLVVSAAGVYGVMAFVVSQRSREIGVRMALGATRTNVVAMIMGTGGLMVATGLLIGGVGAWYLSATAKTFLFGLQEHDARAFIAAAAALSMTALAATIIPARRAASVDPTIALRTE